MAKTSRRNRGINRNSTVQNQPVQTQILPQANLNKPQNKTQTVINTYEAYSYFKRDLKWSAITAGIIAIILIIAYILMH
jgi:hypothetical protein